jgi:CBS domain-containing protein
MSAEEVGALPVVAHGQLVGMLTDRDITVRLTARGVDASTTTVREIMTSGVITCFDEDDLTEAAAKMVRDDVRRLVVLDVGLRPVGLISVVDLAMQADDPRWVADVLARVTPGAHDESAAP